MTKSIFIFIASIFLLLPIVFSAGAISEANQLILCTPLLLALGIPHGAIDNILFLRNEKSKNGKFIGVYLIFVGMNIALWIFFPQAAYVLFLVLSAYHFGQSQFSHYFARQSLSHQLTYFLWGVSILLGLVYFNLGEIEQITSQQSDFAALGALHQEKLLLYFFLGSTLSTCLMLIVLTFRNSLKFEILCMEIIVLGLVLLCFALMPLLIGFTLYFVILHSFKVLREEYTFLFHEKEVHSVGSFIKMLAPFTMFSIAGILLMFGMIYTNILSMSYGYCLLIIISSITLPHVFVMNNFYKRLFRMRLSEES